MVAYTDTVTGLVVVFPLTPFASQVLMSALTEGVRKSAVIIKGPPL